jgi:hypothetical protein
MATDRFNRDSYRNEARQLLNQRLQREEMGDEAYDRMVKENGEGAFRKFGIAFIIVFGVAILVIAWFGW